MVKVLADYRTAYAAAEVLVQEVQSFRNEAGVPAMYELRNAGHHLLRAIDDNGVITSQTDLDAGVAHAKRASYEATETGIMAALTYIKEFQEDYRNVIVADLFPNYVESCQLANNALRRIERAREEGEDRSGDHIDRIDVFRKLRPFAESLVPARLEANKRVKEKEEQERLRADQLASRERKDVADARRHRQIMAATLLGIVVAAIIGYLTLRHPTPEPTEAGKTIVGVQNARKAEVIKGAANSFSGTLSNNSH